VGWSRLKSLLIISGAFGLFQRSVVEAVGGYATDTVGEDAELVVRLHRYLRERGEEYRIEFMPDPVCWTEAPEDLRTLARQRRRWQRGLAETIWRHKAMIGRPSYGALGMLALPYFLVFELLGPLVELVSLLALPLAYLLGALSTAFLVAFLFMAVLLGILLSIGALALEEFSFRRHPRGGDVARMMISAIFENLGYRQLVTLWRVMGLIDVLRGRRDWGAMQRRGLDRRPVAAPPGA
jgi:cellulose synthase/poly-beta-1,6-N-acetylglucosamine synthase-like glycosyltransferase